MSCSDDGRALTGGMDESGLHPETLAVVAGRPARSPGAPLNAPMVPASTYHHGGELGYGRDGNPGWEAFEQALGELEHGHCVTFASGLAAAPSGADGYALRKTGNQIAVAGADLAGAVFGIYGLLEQAYGCGFFLGSEVVPCGRDER